jgi:acetyl-CoA C-acetyltransferase
MTNNPHMIYGARYGVGYRDAKLVDGTKVALTCPMGNVLMGVYGDIVSKEKNVTRQQMDAWAVISQQRYNAAKKAGKFADEIFAIPIPQKKGEAVIFSEDESPRPNTSMETLAQLKPAFSNDGLITAGNSPSINDGAGALLLMLEDVAKKKSLKPLAKIISYATVAEEPKNIPIVPALTVRKALKRVGMKVEDVDLFELNEAFAAVSIIAMQMLNVDKDKVNVNGGAIATGHPVGFTGSRILMTLIFELKRRGGGLGVASLCGVGSQGEATVIQVY